MAQIIKIAGDIENPPTEFILLKKPVAAPSKLVAYWRLDEHSKLYCQWTTEVNNFNK